MLIVRSGTLVLSDVPPLVRTKIKESLRLPNPTYWQQVKRFPAARHYLSPYIPYYEERRDGSLHLPAGVWERLHHFMDSSGLPYRVIDERTDQADRIGQSFILLRENQQGVPECISQSEMGVVRLDTGFGKTMVALKVAELLQRRTLIVVPTNTIFGQFTEAINKNFDFKCGEIRGSKLVISPITVATIQSLTRYQNSRPEILHEFGLIIVDEAHLFVSRIRRKTLSKFTAKYRYGFTATDRRSDQQGEAINFIFGRKLVDRKMERASPTCRLLRTGSRISGLDYAEIISAQIENKERNEVIVKEIEALIEEGRNVLVLTKRVKHYEILSGLLRKSNTYTIDSKSSVEDRSELFSRLRLSPLPYCVLGTFSLLSTGFDLPSLDTLVIAGDLKSDVLAEQSAGRILRLFSGKKDPLIVDIQDEGNQILKRQARLREKFYLNQGWTIQTL